MDESRLSEIAEELASGAEDGWASASFERDGVELVASPKGFRRLAAVMLRAAASGGGFYQFDLADIFQDRPAIHTVGVSWDAPSGWEPPDQKPSPVFWLGVAGLALVAVAVIVFAVIGLLAVVR